MRMDDAARFSRATILVEFVEYPAPMNRLFKRFRQWRALQPWERHMLVHLFFLLPATWAALRVRGFNKARSMAESPRSARETLNKSFNRLRTNGKLLISFVVSPSARLRAGLSNVLLRGVEGHEQNQVVQCFPSPLAAALPATAFAQRCAELTAIASCYGLYRANCLHQSLALCRVLQRHGLPARLKIGVLPHARPFQAHAWVELDGIPLGQQSVADYAAFDRLTTAPDDVRFI